MKPIRSFIILTTISIIVFSPTFSMAQDSLNIRNLGRLWRQQAHAVVVRDSFAYIADLSTGLHILNVSHPTNPQHVSFSATSGTARCIAVSSRYAFVGHDSGLTVFDIANTRTPRSLGNYLLPSPPEKMTVSGNFLYIADGFSGLRIFDITRADSLYEAGFYVFPGYVFGVAVDGNFAYVVGTRGLRILNISNTATPFPLGVYPANNQYFSDVAIAGNYAYLVENNYGLRIVNISNSESPQLVSSCPITHSSNRIALYGNRALVTYQGIDGSCSIVDISNILAPQLTTDIQLGDYVYDVTVAGNYAYIANSSYGLRIIDLNGENTPTVIGSYQAPGFFNDVAVVGNYAYTAGFGIGLVITDIANVSVPQVVGFYSMRAASYRLTVAEHYAYVVAGDSSVHIIDIIDPSQPRQVGIYHAPSSIAETAIENNYLYVAAADSGLQIVDLTDRTNPQEVAHIATRYQASGIAFNGNYLYLIEYNPNVFGQSVWQIIDKTNPINPRSVSSINTAAHIGDIAISGNYAYLSGPNANVMLYNITVPANPVNVSLGSFYYNANQISIVGNFAYFAQLDQGLRIFDISELPQFRPVGFYNTPGSCYSTNVIGNRVYVADQTNLGIYDCSQALSVSDNQNEMIPANISIHPNYPNPFNSSTTISYSLPTSGNIDLKVFDLQGREISTLDQGYRRAGNYQLNLDGKDLSSGTYFLRLHNEKSQTVRKMMLVK